jgi:hypothetical protein
MTSSGSSSSVVAVQEMVGNSINTLVKFFERPEYEVCIFLSFVLSLSPHMNIYGVFNRFSEQQF